MVNSFEVFKWKISSQTHSFLFCYFLGWGWRVRTLSRTLSYNRLKQQLFYPRERVPCTTYSTFQTKPNSKTNRQTKKSRHKHAKIGSKGHLMYNKFPPTFAVYTKLFSNPMKLSACLPAGFLMELYTPSLTGYTCFSACNSCNREMQKDENEMVKIRHYLKVLITAVIIMA